MLKLVIIWWWINAQTEDGTWWGVSATSRSADRRGGCRARALRGACVAEGGWAATGVLCVLRAPASLARVPFLLIVYATGDLKPLLITNFCLQLYHIIDLRTFTIALALLHSKFIYFGAEIHGWYYKYYSFSTRVSMSIKQSLKKLCYKIWTFFTSINNGSV